MEYKHIPVKWGGSVTTHEKQDFGAHDEKLERLLNKNATSDIVATPTNAMSRTRYASKAFSDGVTATWRVPKTGLTNDSIPKFNIHNSIHIYASISNSKLTFCCKFLLLAYGTQKSHDVASKVLPDRNCMHLNIHEAVLEAEKPNISFCFAERFN
jgi:hypothetical protein